MTRLDPIRESALARRVRARFGLRTEEPVVGFVLSGGGNLGAVQVGMLRALVEMDIVPDLIVGCSVGSINGAAFASEPSIRGVNRLERIWRRMAEGDPDVMPKNRLPLAVQIARKGESLHDPGPLQSLLEDELVGETFDGLDVRFECVATDIEDGRERWFDEGPLIPALMASAALPAVFPPVTLEGRTYLDGGVVSELPIQRAIEMGANEIYVLQVGHLGERIPSLQRPIDSLVHAYWMARLARYRFVMEEVTPGVIVHSLPAGCSPKLRFDDFTQGVELAELSYEASIEFLRTGTAPAPVAGPSSDDDLDDGSLARDLVD